MVAGIYSHWSLTDKDFRSARSAAKARSTNPLLAAYTKARGRVMARGSEIKGKGKKAEVRSQMSEVGVRKKSRQSDKRGENKRLGAKSRVNGNFGFEIGPEQFNRNASHDEWRRRLRVPVLADL